MSHVPCSPDVIAVLLPSLLSGEFNLIRSNSDLDRAEPTKNNSSFTRHGRYWKFVGGEKSESDLGVPSLKATPNPREVGAGSL